MNLSRIFQSFAPMFRPPFSGLWLAALLYFAWSFLVYPLSPVLRGDLPDPDDYMYLTQVLDWLHGQGWYDNIQMRMDPPAGVPIHFSRLAQIPMALIILLLERLGMNPNGAAQIMAIIEPLILFGLFFVAIRWLAESFMPKAWVGVTAFVALFTMGKMLTFMPGHVDHHGLNILILTLALGCLMRVMENPAQRRFALYAGGLVALSLVVALEILPWLILISAWVGLWAVVRGGIAARAGLLYALALYLGSALGLVITRPLATIMETDVLSYSIVYVVLAAGVAVCFAGIAVLAEAKAWARWVCGGVLAAISGGWFLHQFPDLVSGPYGGMDPALAQIILGHMSEAKSLLNIGGRLSTTLAVHTTDIVVAIVAALLLVRLHFTNANAGKSWLWRFGLILALLTAALVLSVFYQCRFLAMGEAMAVIPLSLFLYEGWQWAGKNLEGRKKFFAEIALILLVAPLPAVLFPSLFDGRTVNKGVMLFPAAGLGNVCDMSVLEKYLRSPQYYGDHPRLILSGIGMGPEILFRTPHNILSAPFHMNVNGNLDTTRFFTTLYPDEAERIARRRHVDMIVVCRLVPDLYITPSLDPARAGSLPAHDDSPHFIERLMSGRVPPWLRRIAFKGVDDFVVYEVLPPRN